MKKYGMLGCIAIASILIYVYLRGDTEIYMQMKYGFPTFPMHTLLSILMITLYVLYMYYAIYQYEAMKSQIIIRKGIHNYYKIILLTYSISLIVFIIINIIIDYILTHQIQLGMLCINAISLLFPVIYLKKRSKIHGYFLMGCVIWIFIIRICCYQLL